MSWCDLSYSLTSCMFWVVDHILEPPLFSGRGCSTYMNNCQMTDVVALASTGTAETGMFEGGAGTVSGINRAKGDACTSSSASVTSSSPRAASAKEDSRKKETF
eukprot:GHVO01068098.1.p1 GENE.GHVO01068098.1~~GHVO01068098.1.p1  ORF type:complete len:104 (+),score=7.52 GHVO01068098.1:423-734(+)